MKTRGGKIIILFLFTAVLRQVNRNSNRNDYALDDLLSHWRNVNELQAVLNDRENQHAHDDSAVKVHGCKYRLFMYFRFFLAVINHV